MPTDRAPKSSDSKRKSEVVTVRLDPKLKYLAELAARRQRRTLSSYIEWAMEDSLSRVHPTYDARQTEEPSSFADEASALWDVDEPDRFAKLAMRFPELLNHEEQKIWKLIRECGHLWRGNFSGPGDKWRWDVLEKSLNFERLREHWATFVKVARGDQPFSVLPTWQKEKPLDKKPSSRRDDLDDDIHF